jgi:UDP-N-acetylmuramate--alanine ligase
MPRTSLAPSAVVTSTAVKGDNPEVIAARARRIPVVPRAVMLAELMRLKQGIAIAGTHGKTTTTSLVTSVLAEAGVDPTFVIGGKLNSAGANSRLGSGDYIVVEADESDASFLNLMPILSGGHQHRRRPHGHLRPRLRPAEGRPSSTSCTACRSTARPSSVATTRRAQHHPDGLAPGHHLRLWGEGRAGARGRRAGAGGRPDALHLPAPQRVAMPDLDITLNLPGEHNVRNALAAIAVATELELPDAPMVTALAEFSGVGRRFQRYGELNAARRRGGSP